MKSILSLITSFFAIVIGLWKYFAGKRNYKKERTQEAKKELENAKDTSDVTSAFDHVRRM